MRPLEYVVDMGYRDIAMKMIHSFESQSGSLAEGEEYLGYARMKDGSCGRFKLSITSNMWQPMRIRLSEIADVTEEEYAQGVKDLGGVMDTAGWRAERLRRQKRIEEIDARLKALHPICPDCRKPMVVRFRKRDNAPFFGCKNFPSCRRVNSVSPAVSRSIHELDEERSRLR